MASFHWVDPVVHLSSAADCLIEMITVFNTTA